MSTYFKDASSTMSSSSSSVSDGDTIVLDKVTMDINQRSKIALVGKNGCGKRWDDGDDDDDNDHDDDDYIDDDDGGGGDDDRCDDDDDDYMKFILYVYVLIVHSTTN